MSRYVPPHRRKEQHAPAAPPTHEDEQHQRDMWDALRRGIIGIVNKVSLINIKSCVVELFRENIVRGRGVLTRALIRACIADPAMAPTLAALASVVTKEFPAIGQLLLARLVDGWQKAFKRRDFTRMSQLNSFFAQLYVFGVIDGQVVYQLLVTYLLAPCRREEDIDLAADLFRDTFRVLSVRSPAEFHTVLLQPFRQQLAIDEPALKLPPRSMAVVESCLRTVQEWQREKLKVEPIPVELQLVEPGEQAVLSDVDLEQTYNTEEALDRFVYDPDFEANEALFEESRCAILGPDWEQELLEAAAAADAALEEETNAVVAADESASGAKELSETEKLQQLAADQELRQLKKEIFVKIKSSARADEAAHKIMLGYKPGTEATICNMVIESSCEEETYREMYAMIAQRLCITSAKFQPFFIAALESKYADADNVLEMQLQHTAFIEALLLRTGSIHWGPALGKYDLFCSTPSQRVYLQFMLKQLASTMGVEALRKRLSQDRELQPHIAGLFPREPVKAERAINIYGAMGLPELAADLRKWWEDARLSQLQQVKRPRE
jgi:pre-mRNA-splicing factor CWC22